MNPGKNFERSMAGPLRQIRRAECTDFLCLGGDVGRGSLVEVLLTSPPPLEISSGVRILLGLTCLVTGLLTALTVTTAGYLLWMPVGAAEVNLQGRYFHAMMLLLAGLHLTRSPSLMITWANGCRQQLCCYV